MLRAGAAALCSRGSHQGRERRKQRDQLLGGKVLQTKMPAETRCALFSWNYSLEQTGLSSPERLRDSWDYLLHEQELVFFFLPVPNEEIAVTVRKKCSLTRDFFLVWSLHRTSSVSKNLQRY